MRLTKPLFLILKSINKILIMVKRKIFTFLVIVKCKKYGKGIKVNGYSRVNKYTTLGDNVNFNGLEILGNGNVTIGSNFHSGKHCTLITDTHDFDNGEAIPYGERTIVQDIIIEDNVWLGHGVIILGGVTIGEGAIIQAGSTVVKSIPKYGIAGGHPAKVFKSRNIEHYENLKKQNKFH